MEMNPNARNGHFSKCNTVFLTSRYKSTSRLAKLAGTFTRASCRWRLVVLLSGISRKRDISRSIRRRQTQGEEEDGGGDLPLSPAPLAGHSSLPSESCTIPTTTSAGLGEGGEGLLLAADCKNVLLQVEGEGFFAPAQKAGFERMNLCSRRATIKP